MRPIDADAALKALRKCQTYLYDARDPELKIELSSAEAAINNLPTIQSQSTAQSTDLIDRQQAIELIKNYCENGCDIAEDNWCPSCQREQFIKLLKAQPTIQPEPQEGYWIRTDCGLDVECKCSKCGYRDFVKPRDEYWFKRNYCPNCGARMKGERQK